FGHATRDVARLAEFGDERGHLLLLGKLLGSQRRRSGGCPNGGVCYWQNAQRGAHHQGAKQHGPKERSNGPGNFTTHLSANCHCRLLCLPGVALRVSVFAMYRRYRSTSSVTLANLSMFSPRLVSSILLTGLERKSSVPPSTARSMSPSSLSAVT